MKKQYFLGLLVVAILHTACSNSADAPMKEGISPEDLLEMQLQKTQDELAKAQTALAAMKAERGEIVHIVFFKTRTPIDTAAFLAALQQLADIPEVKRFEAGRFLSFRDKRALEDYPWMMQLEMDEEDYASYQQHPIHIEVQKKTSSFMAGPPLTYDYRVK
ncbi:MAG: Dabb family protein [Saprospiraceae bacterium]